MEIRTRGPEGCLIALGQVQAELHGVKARIVSSGRDVSNHLGHGDRGMSIFYVDGVRSSRAKALSRLREYIAKNQEVVIIGPIQTEGR